MRICCSCAVHRRGSAHARTPCRSLAPFVCMYVCMYKWCPRQRNGHSKTRARTPPTSLAARYCSFQTPVPSVCRTKSHRQPTLKREEAVCRTTFARIQNIIAQHAPTATLHIGGATEPPAQRCPCSCSCSMLHAHAAVTSCPNDHSYLVDTQHTCERTPTSPPVPRPAQPTALPRAKLSAATQSTATERARSTATTREQGTIDRLRAIDRHPAPSVAIRSP